MGGVVILQFMPISLRQKKLLALNLSVSNSHRSPLNKKLMTKFSEKHWILHSKLPHKSVIGKIVARLTLFTTT